MVKRVGSLMSRIADSDNIREAFLRAARCKNNRLTVKAFRENLDDNVTEISERLINGSWDFGKYNIFTIHDPKPRQICAAPFADRVVFHAMMRICHPVFDDFQTNDSFASRKGRGQYAALERTQSLCRHYKWFAKTDVCKYFDSIDHQVMLSQLCRMFKDAQLLIYFRDLLDGYEVTEGKGLPIGNLTSQYFANHYLAVADHYAKEKLSVPAMVRYMDDTLFFDNDKERLRNNVCRYEQFLLKVLKLETHDMILNKCRFGIPFLGYVVYPDRLRLNLRSKRRFKRKLKDLNLLLEENKIEMKQYADRATCLYAFIKKADVWGYTHAVANGLYPQGL